MARFQIFRETTLPGTLQPYSIYFVAPASKPDYVEVYVSNATGTSARRVIQESDIQALIDNAVTGMSAIEVVADITARNALNPTTNVHVYVLDASDDTTVTAGSASYIYQVSNTT